MTDPRKIINEYAEEEFINNNLSKEYDSDDFEYDIGIYREDEFNGE